MSQHLEKRKIQHISANVLQTSKLAHLTFRQIFLCNQVQDYVVKNINYHILPTMHFFRLTLVLKHIYNNFGAQM